MTPIDTATNRTVDAIAVEGNPGIIAVSRNRHTAYILNPGLATVNPIDTSTGKVGAPISVGSIPDAIAITP